jgi:uncharacterized protein YfaS (alpha-2-macroglobulin family)
MQLRDRYDDSYWKELTMLKSIRNWSQTLPSTNDYQKHSAEIKVDGLPVGEYLLLASDDQSFLTGKHLLAAQYFHVSSISFVNNDNDYFVLDRETGAPKANARIQLWLEKYDYNTRKNQLTKFTVLSSDDHGYFKVPMAKEMQDNNLRFEINHEQDHLFLNGNQYTYRNDDVYDPDPTGKDSSYEKKHARTFFFTDRSIYRPGQTVFFKGIVVTRDLTGRTSKLYTGQKTQVRLYNANGEPIDSLAVTTSDYGSYSGKFTMPRNRLNGQFSIKDDVTNGEVSFSVEEYKRPKFYIGFEKLNASYKVDDSISVNGTVKAYAGNFITGAQVSYRVVREPRFIYPWLYSKWGLPRTSSMEIANGTIVTGKGGNFSVRFKAIPDLTINK